MTTMSPIETNTSATATQSVDGGTELPSSREARNLAEKHRRDKLNASINELASMVPHVAESTRRLDKTAVLRFAAHGLRLQYVFGKSMLRKRRRLEEQLEQLLHESHPELADTLMQLLDSFFITLTCHGQIVVVSSSVEQLLGHCQSDLYGQNIMHITHPEDHELLREQLIPHDLELIFRNGYKQRHATDNSGDGSECATTDDEDSNDNARSRLQEIEQRLRNDRRCFTVRLARAGTRAEAARSYEIVKIDGCFRPSDYSNSASSLPLVSQLIRRSRTGSNIIADCNGSTNGGASMYQLLQHDAIAQAALHGISGNDIVFVAMARIIRAPKIFHRLLDANRLEYQTRHLIDGRIIDCDQRIGLVAGYMKDEVRNLSPFSFMHQDDVRWVIVALRQMYDCNSDYGESCYRLLSRNGHFIYLQTKGYLEIDKSTNKVHSFLCVNTLLDEEEGKRRVQEMKNKFSVIIKAKIPRNSLQDVPASQNPQQLERIVLYLIENLQKRNENGISKNTTNNATNNSSTQADMHRGITTTPPLALVPPEPASVKNSISKSVNVVNVTAAKNLLYYNQKSPNSLQSNNSETSLSPISSIDLSEESVESEVEISSTQQQRPSVLQMQPSSTSNVIVARRASVISSSKRSHPTAETVAKNDAISVANPAKRAAKETITTTPNNITISSTQDISTTGNISSSSTEDKPTTSSRLAFKASSTSVVSSETVSTSQSHLQILPEHLQTRLIYTEDVPNIIFQEDSSKINTQLPLRDLTISPVSCVSSSFATFTPEDEPFQDNLVDSIALLTEGELL